MPPPHLPPKTSNIETHRNLQRFKLLLAGVLLCVVAGASGASMMIGWIWPKFAEGDTWITSYTRAGLSRAQLEDRVRDEVASRIVSVHRGQTNLTGVNYFNKKIGDGIMLSSDGWLAMYQPQYDGTYKNIYVVTEAGSVYQAQNAVWDKYSGILYLKIKNEQFKVVGFMDENPMPDGIFVWRQASWYHGEVLYPVFNYKIPHLDTAPVQTYSLNGAFVSGEIAINNQGRIAGFITENNVLLPGFYINRILAKVLSSQAISYPSLGVDGWFSQEQPIFTEVENEIKIGKEVHGFLVTNVWSAGNVLRKGDVLLEINGRSEPYQDIVSPDNLWYNIGSNSSVNITVLRNGKQMELVVPVTETKL